ncbi:hypothetical protein [Levilactobacillus sp. N40-8-2]|uniref:hypothetical protein n=1 Tax=Levilactobacillus muriae TaxID=3238987 RepID=UPI0038B396C5
MRFYAIIDENNSLRKEIDEMDKLLPLVPGFITYIALRPFGLFNFYNNADRQMTLVILSVINSAITAVSIKYWLSPMFHWHDSFWTAMLISLLITIIYFAIFVLYNKFSEGIANLFNMNLYDNQGTMEHVLSQNPGKNKSQFLISFDFDGNYISSGYVRNIDDKGNCQVELYGETEDKYTLDQAKTLYSESNENSIIIDYKNRIKNYVIIS